MTAVDDRRTGIPENPDADLLGAVPDTSAFRTYACSGSVTKSISSSTRPRSSGSRSR